MIAIIIGAFLKARPVVCSAGPRGKMTMYREKEISEAFGRRERKV